MLSRSHFVPWASPQDTAPGPHAPWPCLGSLGSLGVSPPPPPEREREGDADPRAGSRWGAARVGCDHGDAVWSVAAVPGLAVEAGQAWCQGARVHSPLSCSSLPPPACAHRDPIPADRRSQGLCPRVQKWFYEKFGEYVEDFRFQPEESTVETEEPLSARRWGPSRRGGAAPWGGAVTTRRLRSQACV